MGTRTHLRIGAITAAALLTTTIVAAGAAASPPAGDELEVASSWDTPHNLPIDGDTTGERLGGHTNEQTTRAQARHDTTRHIVLVDNLTALDNITAGLQGTVRARYDTGFHGFSADLTGGDLDTLAGHPHVLSVEDDQILRSAAVQDNPPWGLDRIDQRNRPLDNKYTYTHTGADVDMYILDTGLWYSHTEFDGRTLDGAYWDFGDSYGSWDCNGHGTHVAGTAAGTTYGVAKQATIIPVRILNCAGSGPTEATLAGINWVIGHHTAGQPAVANMSIGGPSSAAVDAAILALIADGVPVIAAAGNDAAWTCNYSPARVPDAITVAASTINDTYASFSNFGVCNDLFAPGTNIRSAAPSTNNNGNEVASGTSMAAPHVAGAAALILQQSPTATPAQVRSALDSATTKGVLTVCCNDPDKLLFTGPATTPTTPTTTTPTTTTPTTTTPTTTTPTTTTPPATTPPAPTTTAPPASPTAAPIRQESPAQYCPSPVTNPSSGDDPIRTVNPARVFDTRGGAWVRDAGTTTQIRIAGCANVPPGSAAVTLNVTALDAQAPGYLTVYPCGTSTPDASNVNYATGQTVPNTAVSRLSDDGYVCVYTSAATGLLVDVTGYLPAGSDITVRPPARYHDTRTAGGPVPAGTITEIPITGRPGAPADVAAVILNVTALDAQAPGYLSVYPCGTNPPDASNVNYTTGQTVPNAVIAPVGPNGNICVLTSATTGIIIDVAGFIPATSDYTGINPSRMLDTRQRGHPAFPDTTTEIRITGRAGIPHNATTVTLNVTAVEAYAPGYLTVFPCGTPPPNASNVNYTTDQTVPNAVIAKIGRNGSVCVYTSAATDLIIDAAGYAP